MQLTEMERFMVVAMRNATEAETLHMMRKWGDFERKQEELTNHCRWLEDWNDCLISALADNDIVIPAACYFPYTTPLR